MRLHELRQEIEASNRLLQAASAELCRLRDDEIERFGAALCGSRAAEGWAIEDETGADLARAVQGERDARRRYEQAVARAAETIALHFVRRPRPLAG